MGVGGGVYCGKGTDGLSHNIGAFWTYCDKSNISWPVRVFHIDKSLDNTF